MSDEWSERAPRSAAIKQKTENLPGKLVAEEFRWWEARTEPRERPGAGCEGQAVGELGTPSLAALPGAHQAARASRSEPFGAMI